MANCVEKGHFLKNGFVIKIIFYLKQLVKNSAIGKNGLKTPKTDFFNRIGRVEPKEGLSCLRKSCHCLELSMEHFASILIGKFSRYEQDYKSRLT
jgi:hypothetical protein